MVRSPRNCVRSEGVIIGKSLPFFMNSLIDLTSPSTTFCKTSIHCGQWRGNAPSGLKGINFGMTPLAALFNIVFQHTALQDAKDQLVIVGLLMAAVIKEYKTREWVVVNGDGVLSFA